MKLYTICPSCKTEVRVKPTVETRPELEMAKGREFAINCSNCGSNMSKHVNDVRAETDNLILLIGVVLGVVATIFLWVYYGAIGTISIIIPLLFWQQESKKVKLFNSYLVSRKVNK